MYNENNLPETYEEFAKLNGFGETELDDENAPLDKMYYEKMAKLINQFTPFTKEEIQILKKTVEFDIYEYINESFKYGHISEGVYEEVISTFNEMVDYPDEVFNTFGFIYDLYVELFLLYLREEN